MCEVLKERGWEGVGEAEVFLSHVQAEHPKETQNAMVRISDRAGPARRGTKHEGSKVWVDYFCLRQLRNDFKPEQIEELIRETGAVYVFMDRKETDCSYPTRSFCILEFSSAIKGKAVLMIQTPRDGPLAPPKYGVWACCTGEWRRPDSEGHTMPKYSIDAVAATARRAEDKAKVDTFIEEGRPRLRGCQPGDAARAAPHRDAICVERGHRLLVLALRVHGLRGLFLWVLNDSLPSARITHEQD